MPQLLQFSSLFGLPAKTMARLLYLHNSAARIIIQAKKFDHITPLLCELHWLPVSVRTQYNIHPVTFKSFS